MTREITRLDLQAALPDVTSPLSLPGLREPVHVFRDPWGIPHIRAENEWDLFFAQGFATAQDRLWHMDADRHQALGRWSEIVGAAGLKRDRLLRAAGMGRAARRDLEASSPQARDMVRAYAEGVNAFIATTRALPVEYSLLEKEPEPWEDWHCAAVYKIRNTLLGTFEAKLFRTRLAARGLAEPLAKLMKGYPRGNLLTVPPGAEYEGPLLDGLEALDGAVREANWLGEVDAGSNGWSIAGELTQSGLPLVAGDSHRGLDVPSVYYQVHLSCPTIHVIGHSVPGVPGALHFCHNDRVAWGMTHGGADTQDLFIERFRETAGGREYEFRGEWRPAEVLRESIDVRGGSAEPAEITITHHGPVIAGDPAAGYGIAIGDPGLREGTAWLDAARDAMRAESVAGLHRAFRNWNDRVNNYAVADMEGNFGYLHEGLIPVRGEANGWRAVPGWSGDHEWDGYIPHDELPKAINPECGYTVTCNQRVAGHDYPYYVGLNFSHDFRARRVQAHLLDLQPGDAAIDDMAAIHADMNSNPARVFCGVLGSVAGLEGRAAEAAEILRDWDGRAHRDRVAPTIHAEVRKQMILRVIEELFGEAAPEVLSGAAGSDGVLREAALGLHKAMEQNDPSALPIAVEDWSSLVVPALERAVDALSAELGEEISAWNWGRLHRTRPRHPLSDAYPRCAEWLDPPSLSVHGDSDTPLAGSFPPKGPFTVTGLSVNRYIHDPSDWSRSLWIVPLGASGHPGSPHYADQARKWADLEYIPQLWDWPRIEAEAETVQVLRPRAPG